MKEMEDRKEAPLSERPIALQHDDTIYVVGPDVAKIHAPVLAFIKKLEGRQKKALENGWAEPDMVGHGLSYQANCVKFVKKALAQKERLELLTQEWNYLSAILAVQGVQVVSATAEVIDWND